MAKGRRSNDWGFPRWRPYDSGRSTPESQRLCDRHGCTQPGKFPAPKAPNHPERWYFCQEHAAEYNRNWNYFDALSKEEAAAQQAREEGDARGYARAEHWNWGEGDGSRSRAELDALRVFSLPPDASENDIKTAYRQMAKANHPDLNPDDNDAKKRFHAAQAAYEILRRANEWRARTPHHPG